MSGEDILHEELERWAEYIEMIPEADRSAFLVSVLCVRVARLESYNLYLKQRLDRYDNGQKVGEKERDHGQD